MSKEVIFSILNPTEVITNLFIADWYLQEWRIPKERTIQKLETITADSVQFHAVMKVDGIPIATGGVHHHVSLLDKEPRFKIYTNWLALVYTTPQYRGKGYGALLCNFIVNHAREIGLEELALFTDTAERLYARNGWTFIERVSFGERNVVVMRRKLA